jgi:hypothetical protein
MKKLIMTVCGVAMISFATLAQTQDSTSTDYNNQNTVEQSQDQEQTTDDQSTPTQESTPTREATPTQDPALQTTPTTEDEPAQDGTNAVRHGQSRESSGQPTEDQTDQTMERPNEIVPVEGKEGPKGEAVFMENGKYYFMDQAGEKKKIEESELKDKTQ